MGAWTAMIFHLYAVQSRNLSSFLFQSKKEQSREKIETRERERERSAWFSF